ncbi:thyroid adenoma-associated protein homolog isoform X2 [Drosophila biarmipes]|uniref:thyroid adenoma-associated protein homolog isoform X2 n=1 Tax=Drosophila biarmipes TaxID=125945 RepID=UPI001CDB1B3F|nr:thyroid adenoma-associated protein homolog isoform X2 [Drosophila biarmipes]
MNDLNLRVAALKLCAHPKRFAELRDALVPLPERWKSAPQQYVRQFAVAGSSAEQVQVVKDIFFVDPQQDHEQVARFLADLLLASPLKHAVRNQLTKYDSSRTMRWPSRMPSDYAATPRSSCWRHCSSRSARWPEVWQRSPRRL